jgi:threonine dehydrogenase-like Zn-dependent dehydrogenase
MANGKPLLTRCQGGFRQWVSLDGTDRAGKVEISGRSAEVHAMKNIAQAEHQDAARGPRPALRVAVAGLGAIGSGLSEPG